MTYQIMRRYREADEIADRGIAAFPEDTSPFWLEKSETALAQGDTVRARKAMDAAGEPNWYLLYRIAMCERNFAEAGRAAAGLSQDPALSANYPPSFWWTMISVIQGDREKAYASFLVAQSAYEKILRDRREHIEAVEALALLDGLFGSKGDALREMRRAIEEMPAVRDPLTSNELLSNLAVVYAWTGEREKAFEQLAAISNLPNSPTVGDLKLNPIWDPLRPDPRFDQLITQAAQPIAIQ